ncbi:hypothetical protein CQW23_04054 [Capsicum baccatum]|uniref:RRM domain-containing protein n=1 Tax=Capsicum baccatum TaxID=33114 RepID=A0A2G2XDJ6_CAPBA|nr:hypothetical protein CQW23_04054 [Capsicum baccatum]
MLPPVALGKQTKSSTKGVAMARTNQCSTISKCQVTEVVGKELNKITISLGGQGNISVMDKTVARTEVKHSYCTSSTSLSDSHALKKRKFQDLLGFFLTFNFLLESVNKSIWILSDRGYDPCRVLAHGSGNRLVSYLHCFQHVFFGMIKEVKLVLKPWNERLLLAQEGETLVLLENLDPSYASAEVEQQWWRSEKGLPQPTQRSRVRPWDIVWHALGQKVSAKMVQHNTFSNPLNGKAFVIFKSSEAAETAIFELKRRCLMLGDGRPVVARRGTIQEPMESRDFPGHLSIGKLKFQKLEEMMNTVEHGLAVEWRVLQEKSSLWWKALHQQQAAEIEHLRSKLKNPIQNSV